MRDPHLVDEISCAVNRTGTACTLRDVHLETCPGTDAGCSGCFPRAAVHGYLCRGHYERWERAFAALERLRGLLLDLEGVEPARSELVAFKVDGKVVLRRSWSSEGGGASRAVQATSSASTTAGPRVPLSALRLDLDALDRAPRGSVEAEHGVLLELQWVRDVEAATRRHPTEPKRERLHRVRCAGCEQISVVLDPPVIAGGDSTLRCVSCGWTSNDQDHAEAAAYTEALVRDPYRPKRRTTTRVQPGGLEQLAGIARLAAALR